MAREELMWAIGTYSTSRGEGAGGRTGGQELGGGTWLGMGKMGRREHPWAGQGTCGQVGRARSTGSSSNPWGFI